MRLLIVEDDGKIASFISKGLRQAGHVADSARDGVEGLEMARRAPYDVLILDLMLPKIDGLTLLGLLRAEKIKTPALALTAKHSVDDRVKGLDAGFDDYLAKPFAFSELLARLHALQRRAVSPEPELATRRVLDDLDVDLLSRQVVRSGVSIALQPREFALLEYMLRNIGRPLSKTQIMEQVWNYHFDPQTNVVDVLVCRLRNKIDRNFAKPLIHTIRGVGYVIKAS